MKIVMTSRSLSDEYLQMCRRIGLDGIDVNRDRLIPGLVEEGTPNLSKLKDLSRRVQSFALRFFCVNLPYPKRFMSGLNGSQTELDLLCRTVSSYAEASIPITRVRVEPPLVPRTHDSEHGRGYSYHAFSIERWEKSGGGNPWLGDTDRDTFWSRGMKLYETLVPVAERASIKLVMHPTDPPITGAPFDQNGFDRLLEAFPVNHSGLLYCVGTRGEKKGQSLVRQEIEKYGKVGKIFHVHLRNVRGNLEEGGFEEALLDDGDMDMLEIIRTLARVGYDGALNPDHLPPLAWIPMLVF